MVRFASNEENFYEDAGNKKCQVVIYGAGTYGRQAVSYFQNVSCFCDKGANEIKEWNGIKVIVPEQLEKLEGKLIIIVCVKSALIREEIKSELDKLSIDAVVYDLLENKSFNVFSPKREEHNNKKLQKIQLVCMDSGWILKKFANKMQAELERQGYSCTIAEGVDPTADINHHIIYYSYLAIKPNNDTLMITHIDSIDKLEMLKHQLNTAKMGICMSKETMDKLTAYGIPREKLCYINPAQDGVIAPKKYVLGITHRTYSDHRKSETALLDMCKEINPQYFSFKIMGSGWEEIVAEVRSMGFEVEYYNDFDYEKYLTLIPSLDYYLYWGFDEGSMGYLDALRAGVGTIVTPQGYHLDVKDGITYSCRTVSDFIDVLLELQHKREKIVKSVEDWTWKNYVDKHLEVWNYLLGNEEDIYKNQHRYEDGIFSVLKKNS